MKKDRRKKEWQDLTKEEKKFLKVLDNREVKSKELEAIVKALREQKPPTQHYYDHSSDMDKNKCILRLYHPGGGTAYAISYHSQKYVESLSGGEKPHILGIGHYHKVEQLFYRNIHVFQVGTFEAQTPFMRRKRLAAMLGGWILWVNKEEPIGLIGDTHLGSKYCRLDYLWEYYDIANREGVKKIYHAGDMVAGENMFRGQVYELYAHGFKAQAQEVIDEYPEVKGITTYYILGNHDLSFWKTAGADISDLVTSQRKDLVCLGYEEADIRIVSEDVRQLKSLLIPFY